MPGRLIVVTGTGTGIGKTHVSCALLRCASGRVFGYKPIESGVDGTSPSDAEKLAAASKFHVKQFPSYRLRAPISPHLAARLEGVVIDLAAVTRFVRALRDGGVDVLVELPGGLFTPLSDSLRNVDAIALLKPTLAVLIAPDRLGVLHDVGAALSSKPPIGLVGLVAPENADASTGTNASELERLGTTLIGTWPRADVETLATCNATISLVDRWVG